MSPVDALWRAVRRRPLLHFLVIGGLLFALGRGWRRPDDRTIIVGADKLEELCRGWQQAHGRPPGAADQRELVSHYVDQEILVREALALGLDRHDKLVHERLVKLAGFLDLTKARDDASLERAARAIHLERTDPVIRRYLAHLMEIGLEGVPPPPPERAIEHDYALARDQLAAPPRWRLTQVFFARDRHGDADARALLEQLQRDHVGADAVGDEGDPFPTGSDVGPASAAELARRFGSAFAAAVAHAPVGAWVGPVSSPYGLHLVWVHARTPASAPAYASVRNRLILDVERAARDRRRAERMQALRARYHVEVQGLDP